MRTILNIMVVAMLTASAFSLTSCFDDGGYTNVEVPGTVFEINGLSDGDTLTFEAASENRTVRITTNQRDWTFKVLSGGDFCAARKGGGIIVGVTENELLAPRIAEISLKGGDKAQHIYVYQKEGKPLFNLSQSAVEFSDAGDETATVLVKANILWSEVLPSDVKWLEIVSVTNVDGLTKKIELYCKSPNTTTEDRTATLTFTSEEHQSAIGAKEVTITQKCKTQEEEETEE
jgi:hypothetical protein